MKSDGGLHVPGLCSEEVKSVEDVNQVGFNNEQSANIAELLFSRNFLYVGLFLIVYQDYVWVTSMNIQIKEEMGWQVFLTHQIVLRWYGTPQSCDILFIEINNKMKYNYISGFFPDIVT